MSNSDAWTRLYAGGDYIATLRIGTPFFGKWVVEWHLTDLTTGEQFMGKAMDPPTAWLEANTQAKSLVDARRGR